MVLDKTYFLKKEANKIGLNIEREKKFD